MTETDHHLASGNGHGGEHEEIHLPPNSWCPIVLAFSLTGLLLGIVVGVWLAVVGGLATIATIAVWIRNARREYLELPD